MACRDIMARKKYLRRKKTGGSYTYHARVSEQAVSRQMLTDLMDRVFDGSAGAMMLNLLQTAEIDRHELSKVREIVNRKAKEQSP